MRFLLVALTFAWSSAFLPQRLHSVLKSRHSHEPVDSTAVPASLPRVASFIRRSVIRAATVELTEASDESASPVVLRCPDTNRIIECYVDAFAKVEGEEAKYCVAYPCDAAVAICFFDDDEALVPLDVNDEAMNDLFAIASSLLEEEDLFLQRSAITLTIQGDLGDEGEDFDEEFDDEDEEMEDEDFETEYVEVLAEFEHEDTSYTVVRISNPFLLIAKEVGTDEYLLLDVEEAERISPLVEKQLELEWKFADAELSLE